jgi:hypothetical protein
MRELHLSLSLHLAVLDTGKTLYEGVGRDMEEAIEALRTVYNDEESWSEVADEIRVRKLSAGRGYTDENEQAEVNLLAADRVTPSDAPDAILIENRKDGCVMFCPLWADVDRPLTGGTEIKTSLVPRMLAAYFSGKALTDLKVKADIHGNTYVSSYHNVLGKHASANLKALGF